MTQPEIKPPDYYLWHRVRRTVAPLKKGSAKGGREDFAAMMQVPPSRPAERPKDGPLFDALRRTLIRAYNHNKTSVLVVTGKGIRGEGVLRRSFPGWINHADIRPLIAEFAPAHQRHGGGGAWYVFLKR